MVKDKTLQFLLLDVGLQTAIYPLRFRPEAEFLGEIKTNFLRVFLLAIHSLALRFLFLQAHASSYSFYSPVTVHSKGERRKT